MSATDEFNLNVLHRANHEFGANFALSQFTHEAIYNGAQQRIELRLVSTREQVVEIDREQFHFRRGERLVTEHSYKYAPDGSPAWPGERAGGLPRGGQIRASGSACSRCGAMPRCSRA